MYKFLILLYLIPIQSFSLDFRWSNQPIDQNIDASALHLVGSAYLSSTLEDCGLKWYQADLISFGLGLTWEFKDGLMPYEKHGWIGGEGFSKNDLFCDLTGIVTNRLFHVVLRKIRCEQ